MHKRVSASNSLFDRQDFRKQNTFRIFFCYQAKCYLMSVVNKGHGTVIDELLYVFVQCMDSLYQHTGIGIAARLEQSASLINLFEV